MARQTRSAAPEEPPEEQPTGDEGSVSLSFDEPLSWKAGKTIAMGTLIKRLTTLCKELETLEQETVDRDSLSKSAKELVGTGLLASSSAGVKAWTACCLTEMLRLHAPDAPYTAQQLKDIFNLFVNCLKELGNPESPYYPQYCYLLDSLANVKSIVLISDIPDSDQIALALFTSFFDIAKPNGPKQIEYQMTDILQQLVDECNTLPVEVVDIIIAQFLRVVPKETLNAAKRGRLEHPKADDKQTRLTGAVPPPAYTMAKTICNSCVDKMARHICQYFTDVIVNSSSSRSRKRASSEDDDLAPHEPTREELQDLNKAHILAKELWRACPGVLQNVIPQLEQELLAENAELRELSTETIGEMTLTDNFASQAPATWKIWVGRVNDKSPAVRAKWVEAAVKILKYRSDHMAVQLVDLVAIKLNDLDERVRLSACRALRELDYQSITTKLAADASPFNTYDSSNSPLANPGRKSKTGEDATKNWGKRILFTLAERVRDKKIHVRLEGMRCLAKMWDMAYKDLASGNDIVDEQLGWIPSKILDTFYINDPEVNVLLDHVLHEILIPVNYPPIEKERYADREKVINGKGKGKDKDFEKEREKEILEGDKIRVQRLLVLVKGLDTKAKRALFAVPLRQISYAKVMEVFLKACEDYNGGVIEDGDENAINVTLEKFSAWLSQKLPEPPKAKENLLKFAKLHDRRCYHLIRFCFDPDSDYRTVVKALKEIKKRIGEAAASTGILDSLTPLLYRVSQLIYNKSHVAPIVEFSRTDELGLGQTAHEVLKEMSASNPAVFKANVKALSDLLQEQSPDAQKDAADSSSAVDTLKACAGFAKSYPKDMPQERKLLQALVSFALTGKPPAAAKHAVTILMYSATRKDMYAADLVKRCITNFSYGENHFLAKLACLGQLVLLAPDQCQSELPKIVSIAQDLLLKSRTLPGENENDEDADEWVDDSELEDECKAKVLALKILVNTLRHSEAPEENTSNMVLKILMQTVRNSGEIAKEGRTPITHRSRLRLAAAQLLLKLAATRNYENFISPVNFNRLACVAQDRCYQVRRGFVDKLKKYLANGRLEPRFYTMIFLMAYEPVAEWQEETTTWIRSRTQALAQKGNSHNTMEEMFARLLSLLVHHPDFGTQVKDLEDFAKYILYYLRAVANDENISLIYYVAQRVKNFRDRLSPGNSDNLYYLSELAQAVIRHYAAAQKWVINTWPGKLDLPAALFDRMQSAEESKSVNGRSYLPQEVDNNLGTLINPSKRSAGSVKKRKSDERPAPTPKAKKVKSEAPSTAKKKPKKRAAVTPPSTAPTERRRSGRQSARRVSTYKEEPGSDEEVENYAEDDSDEEMRDVQASSEESEVEERPKRTTRKTRNNASVKTESSRSKTRGRSKEPDAEPAPEDMDIDKAESEREPSPSPAPASTKKEKAKQVASPKMKTVRSAPARPTRSARPRAAARSEKNEAAAEAAESSELSDPPSDGE